MSYRDLRNFTEMMRALGYPRLISMENFRSPNFPLVAEVLKWLVLRYDPNVDIPMDVDGQNDRVIFIKSVAQFMATKAHIKLNTKKLYSADGYAVKELLKVTSVLYSAIRPNSSDEHSSNEDLTHTKIDISSKNIDCDKQRKYSGHTERSLVILKGVSDDKSLKIGDLKVSRHLASEITTKGAALYDLLGREVELRELRNASVGRPMDLNEIEKGIRQSVGSVTDGIKKTRTMLENIASDEANLEAKIEKKKQELERNQKRLRSLESVRPAFMDEYEKLELELQGLYEVYIEKYRNQSYLEQILEDMNKSDQEKIESMEISVEKNGENITLEAQDDFTAVGSDGEEEEKDDNALKESFRPSKRPQGAGGRPRVEGTMTGGIDSDEDDSDDLSSGDSEIGMDDDGEDDDDDDDDELIDGDDDLDDDDDDDVATGNIGRTRGRPDMQNPINDSDDDF